MTESLHVTKDSKGCCTLTLNRPEKHNAFDNNLIRSLNSQLTKIEQDSTIRAVILTGKGESFSSGADLNWMKEMVQFDEQTNYQDALELATLMQCLYSLNKPTIAKINGNAFGGALGLIACCDIAICSQQAQFSFTEVKLGLVPAVIAPYILNAIGNRNALRYFLSTEIISSEQALNMSLVHQVVVKEKLDETTDKLTTQLLKGGPQAQFECKKLMHQLSPIDKDLTCQTAKLIARLRTSAEGQEGLSAFLEKRLAKWQKQND